MNSLDRLGLEILTALAFTTVMLVILQGVSRLF